MWQGMAMGNPALQGQLTPKLVDALYVEAMVLADEARSYFDTNGRDDRLSLDPVDRVGFSCESLKVTTRLMHVIAWLLTQRAVAAGELSPAQAGDEERRLGEAPQTDRALFTRLPEAAAGLVQASEELYERVSRIDSGHVALEAGGSPARSLLSRLQRSL
jgi:regulator of CtrA degradation